MTEHLYDGHPVTAEQLDRLYADGLDPYGYQDYDAIRLNLGIISDSEIATRITIVLEARS